MPKRPSPHPEHTMPGRATQSSRGGVLQMPCGHARRPNDAATGAGARTAKGSTRVPWGAHMQAAGYTSFPNLLFRLYTRLGISEGELVFIQQIWTYWWDERLPYPALGAVAGRMGKTVRQIQQYARNLSVRGLLVIVRRVDANGRQLTNAFDLRPLLSALDSLVQQEQQAEQCETMPAPAAETAPALLQPAGRVQGVSPCGLQDSAPQGMQESAPEEHGSQQAHLLDLDSTPNAPQGPPIRPDASAMQSTRDTALIRQTVATLSVQLGDQAPRSSGSRACALARASATPTPEFLGALQEAAALTQAHLAAIEGRRLDGSVNAMPYFFATMERLMARRAVVTPEETPASAPDIPDRPPFQAGETHPLWGAILAELRATLPARTFAERLLCTKVLHAETARLVIGVPTPFMREWLTRVMRRQIQMALHDLGRPDLQVTFIVPDAA